MAVTLVIAIGSVSVCAPLLYRCQLSGFPSGVNHCFTNGTRTTQFCWYNDAQAAQGAAWIVHLFLVIFLVVSIVRLCIWGKRWKEDSRRQALENYDRLDETPAAV